MISWAASTPHSGSARLIPYAGQALLVPWVAEDKAIFLAVGHQPLLLGGVFLLFLQNLAIRRHNVGR